MPDRDEGPGQSAAAGCPFLLPEKALTNREQETLALAAHGHTIKAIALRLSIAERTVKHYLYQARQKLGAMNTTHAVAIAVNWGLIQFDTFLNLQGEGHGLTPAL